jgi:secretion/DNA translocation related CpaE-like protein
MSKAAETDPWHRRPDRGDVATGAGGIIGVLGGCGGAGASSLAAALAAVAFQTSATSPRRRRARRPTLGPVPLLVDLDPLGGGLDIALGAEGVAGARWSGLHATGGRLDPDQLLDGLPRWRGIPFLACDGHVPPSAAAVQSVIQAGREIGPVVLDLGRSTSSARTAALELLTALVVIVPAEIRAVTAAAAMQAALADDGFTGAARLVVRSDGAVIGSGRIADVLDLPLAGSLGNDPGLRSARDRGVEPRRLRRGTRTLARGLLDCAAEVANQPGVLGPPTHEAMPSVDRSSVARIRSRRDEPEPAGAAA